MANAVRSHVRDAPLLGRTRRIRRVSVLLTVSVGTHEHPEGMAIRGMDIGRHRRGGDAGRPGSQAERALSLPRVPASDSSDGADLSPSYFAIPPGRLVCLRRLPGIESGVSAVVIRSEEHTSELQSP